PVPEHLLGRAKTQAVHLAQAVEVFAQGAPDPVLPLLARHHGRRIVDIAGEIRPLYHLREQQGPRTRHNLVDRVAASTQREPPAVAKLMRELAEDLPAMG